MNYEIKNIGKLIFLHLFPGILLVLLFYLLSEIGFMSNFPRQIVLSVAGLVGIVGFQLGYLCYVAKKEKGSFNPFKILGLRGKLNIKELILYTVILFIVTGLLVTLLKPVAGFLNSKVFSGIASWADAAEDMTVFSKPVIILTIFVSFFFFTIIAPVIEEMYFRGFLMERMKWMKNYTPFVNTALFAFYHFWSPWMIVSRLIGMTPLYYAVYKKNSLKLAIIVHCLVNFTDVAVLFALLK